MSRRYVIIGTGIAGLRAAETLRSVDSSADLTLIGDEEQPFYSRPGLAYLLAGALPAAQLMLRSAAELRELAADVRTDQVESIDPAEHRVRLTRGGLVRYDRLLLATGASAVRPSVPGATLEGVVQLDHLAGARALIARAKTARRAVVVGGGPTALELAEGLHARGLEVHYLLRGSRYFASVLDAVESRIVQDALEQSGIVLHRHTSIARALGNAGRLTGVELATGERLDCDLLAIAIGVRPRTELAVAAGLAVERGILVDACLRTSATDVFAAGDVAQVEDPETGSTYLDALWSSAAAEGVSAGRAMAGSTQPHRRRAALNVTRLAGITTTLVGHLGSGDGPDPEGDLVAISRGDSELFASRLDGLRIEERKQQRRVRVVVGKRHVLGAAVLGDARASYSLVRLVRERVDVTALRPALLADPARALLRLIELGEERRASGAGGVDAARP